MFVVDQSEGIAMFDFLPFDIPLPMILMAIVVAVVIKTAKTNRGYMRETQQRLCRGCGVSHPGFADFCRRCGRKL